MATPAQPRQPSQSGQQQPRQDPATKADKTNVAGGDLPANVAHGGQQPGQEGSDQPKVHVAADDVEGRQDAAMAGAPDGPYDEVAAIDQAHAHAAPGTIEHEQLKAQAEADDGLDALTDPRERNQASEARTTKERAQALLKEHEQAAKDNKTSDQK